MKKHLSAAQLWGLTTAYVDMCSEINRYKELNELKLHRNSSKSYMDHTSVSWEYMDLFRTTEFICRKLGNKIVEFINERFDGNLSKIETGYFDKEVLNKALSIIDESFKEYTPDGKYKDLIPKEKNKPRSEGVTLEEAYSLWKK